MVKVLDTVKGNGKIHQKWWQTMVCNVPGASGAGVKFTGWLNDFIYFYPVYHEEDMLAKHRIDKMRPKFDDCNKPAITFTDFQLLNPL